MQYNFSFLSEPVHAIAKSCVLKRVFAICFVWCLLFSEVAIFLSFCVFSAIALCPLSLRCVTNSKLCVCSAGMAFLLIVALFRQSMTKSQKLAKVRLELEQQKQKLKAAQEKSAEAARNAQPAEKKRREQHCGDCHELKSKHTVKGANGKPVHACKQLGIPVCGDYSKCRYDAGHPEEAKAARAVKRLEAKEAALEADEKDKVLLTVLSFSEVL